MKKFIIIPAFLLAITAIPVKAEEGSTTRSSVRTEIEAKRTELKDKIRENQAKLMEAKEKLFNQASATKEFRKDIAKERTLVATKVFKATIVRLEKLVERIESRLSKVKADGKDTTAAEAAITAAKSDIENAKTLVTNMTSIDTASSTASTTAKANFDKVKTEVKAIREVLVNAKKNLMKAVQLLKGLSLSDKNASSTPKVEKPETQD